MAIGKVGGIIIWGETPCTVKVSAKEDGLF
jgi:hypothetical protein